MMNSVNNVNEKRARMHLELSLAVAEFELSHSVTVCKPMKNKRNTKPMNLGKYRTFSASAPSKRVALCSDTWGMLTSDAVFYKVRA